jgi:hypothetical protein
LLLSNVIVNETLPVVLDRCFGGGIAAVVGSTVLIGTTLRMITLSESTMLIPSDVQSSSARLYLSLSAFGTASRSVATCRNPSCSSCISWPP